MKLIGYPLWCVLCCAGAAAWAQQPVPVNAQPTVEELGRLPNPEPEPSPELPSSEPPAPSSESLDDRPVTIDFRIQGLEAPELTNAYNWLGFVAEDQRGRLGYARMKTLHDNAPQSIAKALQPYGYYAPKIEIELRGGPKDYFSVYRVDPGEPVRWATADISLEGEGAESQLEPIRKLAPRAGRRLRHAQYDSFKSQALNLLREAGYLDARASLSQLRVDTAQHLAVATLHFDTGRHWRFGEVQFAGTDKIDLAVLRRYLRFKPGDSFSPQALLDSQFALTDLDYFADVQLDPQRDAAEDDRIPVLVTVTDHSARRDDYGLGYGTDTGARVTAGTEFRRLNSSGHKLRMAIRASEKISGASGEYRIPLGVVPGEFLSFSGAAEQENLAYGTSRDFRLGAAVNGLLLGWKRVYYLRYHRSLFDFSEGDDNDVSLLTPGLSLSRQWLDDPAYARRGLSLFVDAHGAQENVLSDASFVQLRGIFKGAYGIGRRGRLLARVELGATAVRGFDNLPPDERFFAGGDQSVRGYAYQSIGAGRNDNGGVIGGRYLNVFSAEYEQGFRKSSWGAALFADAGGVGDTPNPRLEYGVGLGARYRAPFGSVQLDLAHPLKAGESPVRLHIGVRVGL